MKQTRLNHTMVLHIYEDVLDALDHTANEFVEEIKH